MIRLIHVTFSNTSHHSFPEIIMPEVLALSPDQEPDLSTFENKSGLAEDMKFLASMPELCDVTFLVGETREPVCAVKVVHFHFISYNKEIEL